MAAIGVLAAAALSAERKHYQALVTGQSNAVLLSPHLPPGSYVLVGQSGQSIARWDWSAPGADGSLGQQLLATLQGASFDVTVWWQGESDARMQPDDYRQRLYAVLVQAIVRPEGVRPVIIVEIAQRPGREHLTEVHRWFAAHDLIAFIPTADLPRDTLPDGVVTDHFTAAGYQEVARRLGACVQIACWRSQ